MTNDHDDRSHVETLLSTGKPPGPPLPEGFAERLAGRIDALPAGPASDGLKPKWQIPAAIAATLLLALSAFLVLRPSATSSPAPLQDASTDPVPRTTLLATLETMDLKDPLREEARRMIDDARRLATRFRVPALLGAVVDPATPDSPATSPPPAGSPFSFGGATRWMRRHTVGHGPQLLRSFRRSAVATLPLPSKSHDPGLPH